MRFTRRRLIIGGLAVAAAAVVLAFAPGWRLPGAPLPERLSNQEFWKLVEDFSEPSGYFQSDNLVSNEHSFQYVVPKLRTLARNDGVYLGVAPDQNFTYILAVRPRMAFIVDIRRGNLQTQLMYKALIELSADRAEFLSKLFSRPRPSGLTATTTVHDLLKAFASVPADQAHFDRNLEAMLEHLTVTRGFNLGPDDRQGIEDIYTQFYLYGPGLTYSSGQGRGGRGRGFNSFPTYADLMRQHDGQQIERSYLANEANFAALRVFQAKNLIVPVVGDFAGPKALRAVGQYLKWHGATITAFYTSNVEQYLFRNGVWREFYGNLATLPVDEQSVIIRSVSPRDGYLGVPQGPDGRANVLDPIAALVKDFSAGAIRSYYDVTSRVH